MNESPNTALQRTRSAVTGCAPAASLRSPPAAFPHSLRLLRVSLSLGSLGDFYAHSQPNPIMKTRHPHVTAYLLALFLALMTLSDARAGFFDPPLPVQITFRDPIFGTGRVMQILNKSGKSLEFVFVWKSKTTGKKTSWKSTMADSALRGEFGHMEGYPFASGDTVTISHPDYKTLTVEVP